MDEYSFTQKHSQALRELRNAITAGPPADVEAWRSRAQQIIDSGLAGLVGAVLASAVAAPEATDWAAVAEVLAGACANPAASGLSAVCELWPDAPSKYHHITLPPAVGATDDGAPAITKFKKVQTEGADAGVTAETVPVATAPVFVARRLLDVETQECRREVVVRGADGEWRSIVALEHQFEVRREVERLISRGLPTNHRIIGRTMDYLTACAGMTIPVSRTVSRAAWFERGGRRYLILPNCTWGPDGPADCDMHYAADATPDFLSSVTLLRGNPGDARRVVELLLAAAAEEVAWSVVGWAAASTWAPLVRRTWGCMPHMCVYGGHGSGKTTYLRHVTLAFAGHDSQRSARRPTFSLMRELAAAESLILFIDEYRRYFVAHEDWQKLHHFLRVAYDGGTETRGLPDQRTRDYHLRAPVILAGESAIDDPALRERCVLVPVARADIVNAPGAREALAALRGLGEDALRRTAGFIVAQALAERQERIQALLEEALAAAEAGAPGLGERPRRAIALVLAGASWVAEVVGLEVPIPFGHVINRLAAPHRLDDDSSPLAAFIRYLETQAAVEDARRREVAWRYDAEEQSLVVHQEQALSGFAAWARQRGEAHFGREALLQSLEQSPAVRTVRAVRRLGGLSAKCIVFDCAALERHFGVPTGAWVVEQPWGDEQLPAAF